MLDLDFDINNNKKYKREAIRDRGVYASKTENNLSDLYHLLIIKSNYKKENTWKILSVVQHLKKLICFIHKKNLEKTIALFPSINFSLLIIRPMIKPIIRKKVWPIKSVNKQAKNLALDIYDILPIFMLQEPAIK